MIILDWKNLWIMEIYRQNYIYITKIIYNKRDRYLSGHIADIRRIQSNSEPECVSPYWHFCSVPQMLKLHRCNIYLGIFGIFLVSLSAIYIAIKAKYLLTRDNREERAYILLAQQIKNYGGHNIFLPL